MDSNKQNSRERQLSEAVRKAIEQLMRDIENEPDLVLETESRVEQNEQTLNELRSWLFGRRQENGYPDDSSNN